jgi:hypothetical protein
VSDLTAATGATDRVRQAIEAATTTAAALDLGPWGDLQVTRVGTSVLLVSPGAQVMFRVDDQVPADRVERQVAVASLLQHCGVPAVHLAGGPRQPVVVGDPAVAVSAWHLEELTDAPVGAGELGGLARQLHAISADDAEHLQVPPFEPFVAIAEQLATAARVGATGPDDLELLAGLNGRLAAAWPAAVADAAGSTAAGLGVVHGDLHAGNVLATTRGLVVADLELAGIGPVAYDLVAVVVAVERYGAPVSTIDDFAAGYGHPIPAAAHHGVLRDTYELWLTAWAVANRHVDDDHDREARARLARWHHPAGDIPVWTLL